MLTAMAMFVDVSGYGGSTLGSAGMISASRSVFMSCASISGSNNYEPIIRSFIAKGNIKNSKPFTEFNMLVMQANNFHGFCYIAADVHENCYSNFRGAVDSLLPKQEFGIIWARS